MKVAIPTNDGITIAPGFRQARGFLVCTIEFGVIREQEMRWNLLSEILTTEDGFLYNLHDCSLIVSKTIGAHFEARLKSENKKVVITSEDLITNILIQYRDHEMVQESNLTCCP